MSIDDQLRKQMENKCIHFTGLFGNTECKAGMVYAEVRDDSVRPYLFPCLNQGGECSKCQFPTEEEIQEHIKDVVVMGSRAMLGLAKIKEQLSGTGATGMVDCECGGIIRYAVAGSNGHIRGKCTRCEISFNE